MNVNLSVKPENEYLLINVSGVINNQEENILLTKRFYHEITKHNSKNTIIDISETSFPHSIQFLNDIVTFYSEELPEDVKCWKIAVVDESSYLELVKYWEFAANQKGYTGYRVFPSIHEAQEYITT